MKTWKLITLLAAIFLIAASLYIYPRLSIISGYNAKILCSCLYISGLSKEKAEAEDLGYFPVKYATNVVDDTKKTVTSSVLGLQKRTAYFHPDLGCALVHSPALLKHRNRISLPPTNYKIWNWPVIDHDSLHSSQRESLRDLCKVVQNSFVEKDPEKPHFTRAVLVIHDGKILCEEYAPDINMETPLPGWSMQKSVTAALFGRMENLGLLNRDDSLLLPEWFNSPKSSITFSSLLQMNSGLEWKEDYSNISSATVMLYEKDSMGAFAAQLPPEYEPGHHWEYSSGSSNIISYAMANKFNGQESCLNFPREELFSKMGTESFIIETDGAGYLNGSSYGFATARDWARLGALYLQNGIWNDDTILTPDFVEYSLRPAHGSDLGYGAQIWLNQGKSLPSCPEDTYSFRGHHGQRVFVVPSENLIVVRLGVTYKSEWLDFDTWLAEIIDHVRPLQ